MSSASGTQRINNIVHPVAGWRHYWDSADTASEAAWEIDSLIVEYIVCSISYNIVCEDSFNILQALYLTLLDGPCCNHYSSFVKTSYYLIIPCHMMFDLVIIVLGFQDQTVALYTRGENGGYGHRRCGKLEFKL